MPENKNDVEQEVLNDLTESAEEIRSENSFAQNGNYEEFVKDVEEKRLAIHEKYKKSKRLSNIVMIIVVALIVGSFVLMTLGAPLRYVGWGIGGATLVGMIIFYILNKNKFPTATKEYIKDVSAALNGYAFHDCKLTKLNVDPNEKLDQVNILTDRVYTNVSRIGSRNVVHGKYEGEDFTLSELAVYTKDRKNETPLFVGKYLSTYNKYKFNGRVIVVFKGEKEIDLPTDTFDLELVKEEDNMMIYAPKDIDYREVIDSLTLSKLKKIAIEKHLMNLNMVVWGGLTAAYMSFDDATMVLPFEHEFNGDAQKQFQEVTMQILDIISVFYKDKVIESKAPSTVKEDIEAAENETVEEENLAVNENPEGGDNN